MIIYRACHLFNHLSIKGPSMVLTKQVVVIIHDILLILASAFSPDVLLYNNIVNSLQNIDLAVVFSRRGGG